MGYRDWFEKHASKHKKIVDRLVKDGFDQDEIIEYFDFENMKLKEIEFCPLYAKDKKCHDIDELNCYLCACPNFRFDDSGIKKVDDKTQYSFCDIDSKDGRVGIYSKKIHQDCSLCSIPHATKYVKDKFDYDWKKMMSNCNLGRC